MLFQISKQRAQLGHSIHVFFGCNSHFIICGFIYRILHKLPPRQSVLKNGSCIKWALCVLHTVKVSGLVYIEDSNNLIFAHYILLFKEQGSAVGAFMLGVD